MKSYSDSYKAAGVDVTAGYESVELMKEHVKRTVIPGVVSGIGGFGGLFAPGPFRHGGARAGLRHRRRGHQAENRHAAG